jgi:hypothetical protein
MDTRNFTLLYSGNIYIYIYVYIYIVFDTGFLVNTKYKIIILLERILQERREGGCKL